MDNEAVTDILRAFAERPIAFYPAFARLTGSVKAGVFLSQLFYWTPRGTKHRGGWIEKTLPEWLAETAMSRKEIETARARCVELELVEFKQAGLPAKTVYRLDLEALIHRLRESRNQGCEKVATKDETFMSVLGCEKVASLSYTETTSETSSEIEAPTAQETAPTLSAIPDDMRAQKAPPRRKPEYFGWQVVKSYLDATGRKWIAKADAEFLNENVSDALKFAGVAAEWIARGYNPTNFAGLVDVYYNGWRATPTRQADAKPTAAASGADRFARLRQTMEVQS